MVTTNASNWRCFKFLISVLIFGLINPTEAQSDCSNYIWCGVPGVNGNHVDQTSISKSIKCCTLESLPGGDILSTVCDSAGRVVEFNLVTKTPNTFPNIDPKWFDPLTPNTSLCQINSNISSLDSVKSLNLIGAALPGGLATDSPWWEWIGNISGLNDLTIDNSLYLPGNTRLPRYNEIPLTAFSNSSITSLHLYGNNLGINWRSWLKNFVHLRSIDIGGGPTRVNRIVDGSDLTVNSTAGFPNLPVKDGQTPSSNLNEFGDVQKVATFFTSFAPNLTSLIMPFNLTTPLNYSNPPSLGQIQELSLGLFPPLMISANNSGGNKVYPGFESLFSDLPPMKNLNSLTVTIYGEQESSLVNLNSALCQNYPNLQELMMQCSVFTSNTKDVDFCGFPTDTIPDCFADTEISNLTIRPFVVNDLSKSWWSKLPSGMQHLDILAVTNPTINDTKPYPQPFPGFKDYIGLKSISLTVLDDDSHGLYNINEDFVPELTTSVFLRGQFGGRLPRNFAELKKCNLYSTSGFLTPRPTDWICNSFTSKECSRCNLIPRSNAFFREYNPQWWVLVTLIIFFVIYQNAIKCYVVPTVYAFITLWNLVNALSVFSEALRWHQLRPAIALLTFIVVSIILNVLVLYIPLRVSVKRIVGTPPKTLQCMGFILAHFDISNLLLITTATKNISIGSRQGWFQRLLRRKPFDGSNLDQVLADAAVIEETKSAIEELVPRYGIWQIPLAYIPCLCIAAYLMSWIPSTAVLFLLISESLLLALGILMAIKLFTTRRSKKVEKKSKKTRTGDVELSVAAGTHVASQVVKTGDSSNISDQTITYPPPSAEVRA